MSNAAIYAHANAYDTTAPALLGRVSAGESFLRGFIRHAKVDRFHFYNSMSTPRADLDALIQRIEATDRPVRWIAHDDRPALSDPGVLYLPVPGINSEAYHRRLHDSRSYGICGITHTTATATVMKVVADMLVAPVEDYDSLICTSNAVRASIEAQFDMMRAYMAEEYGPRRRGEPMRVTIPLGVNATDFVASPEHRKAWRERLQIPDDAVVALYVGRFNIRGKMNPALMAMALERAARRTGRPLYWVNSGWGENPKAEASFHEETRKVCPSVHYLAVDGRKADARFSIWSVADLFISFSDNIQETFGLTPIEAMAAGLPSVVSDWDGYRDTVRDGIDGFRIPTIAPRPGMGEDFSEAFSSGWMHYDNYVGATGQYVAVDLDAAERHLCELIESPQLRRRFGAAAQARAREVFDWSAIIPQYQALWAEQNVRRKAAAPDNTSRHNPVFPDPYALFAAYPTRHLQGEDLVTLRAGMTADSAIKWLERPLALYSRFNRPTLAEVRAVVDRLGTHGPARVADLVGLFPPARRAIVERGLLWLARHDVVALTP